MREVKIPPSWTYIVHCISQSFKPYNVDLKDTWFTPDLEKDTNKTPSHDPSVSSENNNKILTPPQFEPHLQESLARKGASASEVHERPAFGGVQNKN